MNKYIFGFLLSAISLNALANDLKVNMTDLNTGKSVGEIKVSQNKYGTLFVPALSGISGGLHGFHIHENASCEPSMKGDVKVLGGGAGGHFDPSKTGKHGFPWTTTNHLGDLPALYIDADGKGEYPVLAPRVKLKHLKGRALMIHVGGDNHSDHPHALGGGGARLICGVVESKSPKK